MKNQRLFPAFVIFFGLLMGLLPFFSVGRAAGRSQVLGWYIKDFQTEIRVNQDSSLTVTERIIADAGQLTDKHGIFRILPTQIKLDNGKKINTSVKLISITDFAGQAQPYQTIKNNWDRTLTWKIGDPDIEVQGENDYLIKYQVKNAIRSQGDFDEFYWNLLGAFWELEIDNFQAQIIFPSAISKNNSQISYYTGYQKERNTDLANYQWLADNVLQFSSTRTIQAGEGITASISFPKGIFQPYRASFLERYGGYLWLFLPLIALMVCLKIWLGIGKDPKLNQAIVPEYEIPGNLSPLAMGGLLSSRGSLQNDHISAAIVNLAVKGIIRIKMLPKFLGRKDYQLIKTEKNLALPPDEQELLDKVFGNQKAVVLSQLRKDLSFAIKIQEIKKSVQDQLIEQNLMTKTGLNWMTGMVILAGIIVFLGFFSFSTSFFLGLGLIISAVILLVFGCLMPRRTLQGSQILLKIRGFEMYMRTAEKHRQQFYEKENIFEKLLPYAMVFGLTSLWIKKMRQIYGAEYFSAYYPVWFVGLPGESFDIGNFSSQLNSLSSAMSASTGGASGAGGGGFAGGGGGGGGGGGW